MPSAPRTRRRGTTTASRRRSRAEHRRQIPLVLPPWLEQLLTRWSEPLLIAALFSVALATRLPYLLRLPHFTDETVEIQWALRIWRGEILPLTASDRYYGPLHPYIVALMLQIFGPSIALPRAIVLVFGALTVVLVYLLGRELAGRWAGLIAAGLLATAPQHIIVNSHVAWQNSTTPFYATLTFLALTRYLNGLRQEATGTGRARPFWLLAAGALYGLTLQTHIGTIVLAPALLLTFLTVDWRTRQWRVFRRPWPWLAPLMTILSYSPVIIYNLMNDLAGMTRVQTRRSYAYEVNRSWEKYWQNEGDFWLALLRLISNPMRIPEERLHYLTSPYLLIMAGFAVAGIVLLLRRGQPLPACALASTALIMPAFNKAYGQTWDRYMLTGRYLTFLLPLAEIAIAVALLALIRWTLRRIPRNRRWMPFRVGWQAIAAGLVVILIAYPLQPLFRYYSHEAARDPDNASFLATLAFIEATRQERTPVVVSGGMAAIDLKDGTNAREVFDLFLTLKQIPHQGAFDTHGDLNPLIAGVDPDNSETWPLIIMMRDDCWEMPHRQSFQRVSPRYNLRELYWTLPSYYAVYRYVPAGHPANCMPATGPELGE